MATLVLLETVAVMEERLGHAGTGAILLDAQIHALPSGEDMIPEMQALRLHRWLALHEPMGCYVIAEEAGARTADYIIANRIPAPVVRLLRLLPAFIAAPVLMAAIRKHAWTFAGAGVFTPRGAWAFAIDRTAAGSGASAQLRDEIMRVRARLAALHASIARNAGEAGERRGMTPALLDELRSAEAEMERLVTRDQNTRGVASLFAQPLDTDTVLSRLESDDAMVAYFIAGDELMAFVAQRGEITSVRCIANASDIGPLVDKLLYQLRAGVRAADARSERAIKALSRTLHDLLIEPLLEQAPAVRDASRLIVVPFGALHALPFAALFDGEKYLIERYEIHTAPSASIACASRGPRRAVTGKPLVVAVADENAPLIDEEADLLGRAHGLDAGRDVLRGGAATIDQVRQAVRGRSTLHFACHGRFIGSLPNASGIKLADGWMPVREIVDLELDAQVVFLAACETGRNSVLAGDELAGISRAFLAAGARCLVAGLWSVRDHAALAVSESFHQEFASGARPSAALRQAVLASLQKWSHPSWWSPFVVTGSLS